MVMPALRRNAHETNHDRQLRRVGLLVDNRGVPAHRAWQHWTSRGLREVGVRLCMRYHHVEGIASGRQARDVNPDHVDSEVSGESPAGKLAG